MVPEVVIQLPVLKLGKAIDSMVLSFVVHLLYPFVMHVSFLSRITNESI